MGICLGAGIFSLSVAGNGTLIYGSYLSKDSIIPADARMVAIFDTLAAMLAALVIIPAMAVAGQRLNQSGPGLMFIFLPNVLSSIPGGFIILIVFFLAVTFAALTSLINLFEAPTAYAAGDVPSVPYGGLLYYWWDRYCGGHCDCAHCVGLDGRMLHVYLPHRRPAGRGDVLLGMQEGLCAGAGQSGP
ncbi:MAG: hypothetical protein ACLR1K_01915 [Oscillospiraceae bacterium]